MRSLVPAALAAALALTGCSGLQDALESAAAVPPPAASRPAAPPPPSAAPVAAAPAPDPELEPSAELRASLDCADVRPISVQRGIFGDYTYRNGFETKTQEGFLQREDVAAEVLQDDCYFDLSGRPLTNADHFLLTYPAAELEAAGDFEAQCVLSQNPSAGAVKYRRSYPLLRMDAIPMRRIILRGPNDTGYESIDNERDGKRAELYDETLEERGHALLSFNTLGADASSGIQELAGETAFCAYTDVRSGKTLFATEFVIRNGY